MRELSAQLSEELQGANQCVTELQAQYCLTPCITHLIWYQGPKQEAEATFVRYDSSVFVKVHRVCTKPRCRSSIRCGMVFICMHKIKSEGHAVQRGLHRYNGACQHG